MSITGEKNDLRREADSNIRRSLIKHSRVVRVCAAIALGGGFVAAQQDSEAALVLPAAGLLGAGLSGRKSKRECAREVDAYAVNVVKDRDPFSKLTRDISTRLVVEDGDLKEKRQFDHWAASTNSPLASVKYPELFVAPSAMAAGMVAGAIYNNQYLESAERTVYGVEGIAVVGTLIALGASSATMRGKIYQRQLDNIEGPTGLEAR